MANFGFTWFSSLYKKTEGIICLLTITSTTLPLVAGYFWRRYAIYMDILYIFEITGHFFLLSFFVLALIYSLKISGVNKSLKAIDENLYKRLRVKFFSFNRPFLDYVFKKEYMASENLVFVKLCQTIYYYGWAMQWSFNIGMGLIILHYVISI